MPVGRWRERVCHSLNADFALLRARPMRKPVAPIGGSSVRDSHRARSPDQTNWRLV
jgi:hypothetical protein